MDCVLGVTLLLLTLLDMDWLLWSVCSCQRGRPLKGFILGLILDPCSALEPRASHGDARASASSPTVQYSASDAVLYGPMGVQPKVLVCQGPTGGL